VAMQGTSMMALPRPIFLLCLVPLCLLDVLFSFFDRSVAGL